MKCILSAILTFIISATLAQLSDSFSDGNLSRNPPWTGDTTVFKVHSGSLHLAAPPASGKAWISTSSKAVFESRWELAIQMDFNPSSSNYLKVYLTSDRQDLSGSLSGYFLMIGNSNDEVSLYRQTGTTATKIIDGRNGILDLSIVRLRVLVTTDQRGQWTLSTKLEKDENWIQEGNASDNTYKQSDWFGMMCVFTSTRSDKFHFDDIVVSGSPWPDQEAPVLTGKETRSEEEIFLTFSEPVTAVSGVNPFTITESGYKISETLFINESVIISVQTLKEGIPIHLNIRQLKDGAGNLISDTTIMLLYVKPYTAKMHDVIFNEILPDPLPSVGLPELEFVELFNRTDRYIDLTNWKISDQSTTVSLPLFLLAPKSLIALYPQSAGPTGLNAISTHGLPSFNNLSDRLFLYSDSGSLIDSLSYRSTWHAVSGKQEGGWSLERIDPDSHCDPDQNWTSSVHPDGGTPGKQNSVLASRPDLSPPIVLDAEVMNARFVIFTFSEPLEDLAKNKVKIKVDPDPGMITKITQPQRHQLNVEFGKSFENKILYGAELSGIRDCPGNLIESESGRIKFFLPEKPDSLDVVINEILFDPIPGGVDFVELYNRSDKFFRLRDWSLSNDEPSGEQELFSLSSVSLLPGRHLAITSDGQVLNNMFPMTPDSVLVTAETPSMPDDEGFIAILDADENMLDSFSYSRKFHLPMIRNEEGVSLERIDPDQPTQSENNWRSAALGKATPGLRNSSFRIDTASLIGVRVEPEIFSIRSGSGFTRVLFDFTEPDLFSTVAVYDLAGLLIRELADNQNIGTSGFLRWDGDHTDGRPVDPGYYIVVIDVYNDRGYQRRYRSRIVVLK